MASCSRLVVASEGAAVGRLVSLSDHNKGAMDKAGIKHDPRNARKHNPRNVAMVESSIQRDGFGRSILLANDGTVIAGNATIDAAASAGLDDVIVVESDGTKVIAVKRTDVAPGSEEFTRLALADNRAAELASWDASVIAALNDEMDLSAFFGDDELAKLLAGVSAEGLTDPDNVPTVTEPTTKPGDLWLLGRHRLLCGDSTVATDVERLMGGAKADMVLTDPPYGMDYHGTVFGKQGLRNDTEQTFEATLSDSMALVYTVASDAVVAVFFGPARLDKFFAAMQGFNFHRLLTIYKPNRMAKPWHGWIMTSEVLALFSVGSPTWVDENHCHDVYTFDYSERPDRSIDHATVKPISIVSDVMSKGSGAGAIVYDPFLGSGTTLIAAEQLNRTCFGCEIDPHYVDVIVKRWEDFTGGQAVLDAA